MGEAKRRGTKEQRVQEGVAKRMNAALQAKLQLELLQRRRAALEQTLPPLDKLSIQQHQMLAEVSRSMGKNIVFGPAIIEMDTGVGTDMSAVVSSDDIPVLSETVEEAAFFEPIEHVTQG